MAHIEHSEEQEYKIIQSQFSDVDTLPNFMEARQEEQYYDALIAESEEDYKFNINV